MSASATLTTRAATKALRPVQGILQRKCACGTHTPAGGECEECGKKEKTLQRKGGHGREPAVVPPAVGEVLRSAGQPLDAETRAFMEPRFGHNLGNVRLHTGPGAAASAEAVNAEAYTVGHDIVFGAGRYAPMSPTGRQLIAHELTHVIQQSRGLVWGQGDPGDLRIGDPGDAFEHQAEGMASGIHDQPTGAQGVRLPLMSSPVSNTIQRRRTKSPGSASSASRGAPIVEDGQPAGTGQMQRSQFLTTLRDTLLQECEVELAPFGRTAKGCPYILRTVERYASRPISSLMRLIRHFGKPPAGADARGLIRAVTQRARTVARKVGEKRGHRLQASTADDGMLHPHDPIAIRAQFGGGHPLEAGTRRKMEGRFGATFDAVRVHLDSTAERLNTTLGARAFTIGSDIAFAAGQYHPGAEAGDALIAHELAHTIQQRSGNPHPSGGADDQELERQADRAAATAIAGRAGAAPPLQSGESGIRVQRWPLVLAGAIATAEVGTEAVVVTEIAVVSTEVVVADGALVVAADVAAPTLLEAAAPTVLESVAPTALETVAPAALETAAATAPAAVSSTAAATVGVGVAATTLSSDSPTSEEEDKKKCRPGPCGHSLPVSWPAEFPYPGISPRLLMRTTTVEREWLGIDRAADQSRLAADIRRARARLVPPPQPCFDYEAEPNAPYDAHHIHPLYLGGEEAEWNLCALRADHHQRGHPRLNNQTEHFEEYMECGICSGFLSHHPPGQAYHIVASK